jgi:hypothetical protein
MKDPSLAFEPSLFRSILKLQFGRMCASLHRLLAGAKSSAEAGGGAVAGSWAVAEGEARAADWAVDWRL